MCADIVARYQVQTRGHTAVAFVSLFAHLVCGKTTERRMPVQAPSTYTSCHIQA